MELIISQSTFSIVASLTLIIQFFANWLIEDSTNLEKPELAIIQAAEQEGGETGPWNILTFISVFTKSVLRHRNRQSVHRLLQYSIKVFMKNPVGKYELCKIKVRQNNKIFSLFLNTRVVLDISRLSCNSLQRVLSGQWSDSFEAEQTVSNMSKKAQNKMAQRRGTLCHSVWS